MKKIKKENLLQASFLLENCIYKIKDVFENENLYINTLNKLIVIESFIKESLSLIDCSNLNTIKDEKEYSSIEEIIDILEAIIQKRLSLELLNLNIDISLKYLLDIKINEFLFIMNILLNLLAENENIFCNKKIYINCKEIFLNKHRFAQILIRFKGNKKIDLEKIKKTSLAIQYLFQLLQEKKIKFIYKRGKQTNTFVLKIPHKRFL